MEKTMEQRNLEYFQEEVDKAIDFQLDSIKKSFDALIKLDQLRICNNKKEKHLGSDMLKYLAENGWLIDDEMMLHLSLAMLKEKFGEEKALNTVQWHMDIIYNKNKKEENIGGNVNV